MKFDPPMLKICNTLDAEPKDFYSDKIMIKRCLMLSIVAFCESDTGKQLFEEWKLKRERNKILDSEKSKSKTQ